MPIIAIVANCHVTGSGSTTYGYAFSPSVVVPFVGVTAAAPIWHVAPTLMNFPGCITNAFAVIHTPGIYHAILISRAPRTGVGITIRGVTGFAQNNVSASKQ